ncbi:MAG: DUF262 domain-containing protein [Snowella sp.]|nr:DUF262 domain-containing protein [Snowella sp.]
MVNVATKPHVQITQDKINRVEEQIRQQRRPVDYKTLEYPIEIIVQKYSQEEEEDKNEIFVPDYQRELVWTDEHQSKFIESVFLGLPIPYIFVADVTDEIESESFSRLEIIDGTQRIRTLERFLHNKLTLSNLKKLNELNGLSFGDLPPSRQQRFKRTTLRMILLTEATDEEVRRDLFERINSGSIELNEMEKRIGGKPGPFLDFIQTLSRNEQFQSLCHFSQPQKDRRDPQEYILRFFAFLHNYQNYSGKVHIFLDEFLTTKNEEWEKLKINNLESFTSQCNQFNQEFLSMLEFIAKYYPDIFSVGISKKRPTTRSKFEAISVGVALALRETKNIQCPDFSFLKSKKFDYLTDKNSSSTRQKVEKRIEYVKNHLLQR